MQLCFNNASSLPLHAHDTSLESVYARVPISLHVLGYMNVCEMDYFACVSICVRVKRGYQMYGFNQEEPAPSCALR